MTKRALLMLPVIAVLAIWPLYGFAGPKDAAATPPAASSDQGGPGESCDMPHHGHSLHAIWEKLGITDEQKGKIRSLYTAYRDNSRKARTELMSIVDEKKTMLLSGKVDQQKLAKLDDQAVKLIGDVLGERLKLQRDRLALLTPEQRSRVADWRMGKPFHRGWKGRYGHGGHSFLEMAKNLGLSDDQKKQVRALFIAYQDRTRKARMDLMSLKDQKSTMLISEKADLQKLAQLDDQIVKLVTDKIRDKLKYRRDRLGLLTPEQMGRMADWQAEKAFHARMKEMSPEGKNCPCRRD